MVDIFLVTVGLVTTFILAFASHDAKSRVVKALFWICLLATAGIIVISGIGSTGTSRDLRRVRDDLSASGSRIRQLDKKNRALELDLVAVRDYSAVAQLDALGNPPNMGPGSPITIKNDLTALIDGTYSLANGKIHMGRDEESERRYRQIIAKFPNFPFGYYFLALCLKDRGDPEWRTHARHAVDILRMTTQIDGHSPNHDEVLGKLTEWLENNETTQQGN